MKRRTLVRSGLVATVVAISPAAAAPPFDELAAQPDVFESASAEEGGDLILDRGNDRNGLMAYLGVAPRQR